ncbi:MAG TPA: hypothetical protein DCW46_01740 [Desulfotomaculum sp.]|nr:hypothetical protein [Desulfotomaculum sp.]
MRNHRPFLFLFYNNHPPIFQINFLDDKYRKIPSQYESRETGKLVFIWSGFKRSKYAAELKNY